MSLLDQLCSNKQYNQYYEFFKDFRITPPEGFNFSFDVIDPMGDTHANEAAMLWLSPDNEERTFTFRDLKRLSSKVANALQRAGIRKGDVVLLALRRHYQYWYAMLGLHKLGAVAIPVTHQLTPKDYAYRMNAASAKAIISTIEDGVPPNISAALADAPSVELCFAARSPRMENTPIPEGFLDFDLLVEEAGDTFPRPVGDAYAGGDEDTMLIYFTSGTTGYPKMVAHSFYYPLGHIVTARYWHNCKPGARHLTISDSGWGKAAWGKMYGQWLCESSVFVYDFDRFSAADILQKLQDYKISTFCAPPTMYRYIIKEPLGDYDLSNLTYATTAGEALNPEVFEQFKAKVGLEIHEGFGQTETTMVLATFPCMDIRIGAMGLPTPGYDVQVLDAEGNISTLGETGEICIRYADGKPIGMAQGYYRDPALTEKAWKDGWYHTGDTAWQDGMGYFWYVGRTDDVIKSSGYRIGPFEVESALMEHPSVLEAAVTPIPDDVRGQVVKATIVLAKGYTASEELKKELQAHVKKSTAPYKYPRVVDFVEALPKTISGKIKRAEIRERDRLAYLNRPQ
ncbi:AMP-binding protein [Christensenellaceae bacterium OttesenSCG-928-L17]|nr:AMP-binding protein [Christensenellaceae bacterium OttesenSCG-928-L17]